MTDRAASPLVRMIHGMAEDQRVKGAPDQDLLRRFGDERDEAAFRGLLWRHGPMVLSICRSVLGQEADAEDAFQATFLVLARQAKAIRKTGSVGSWLHGVAYRTALKARAERIRRRKHEGQPPRANESDGPDDLTWREVREVIHAELGGVPEPYRAALVLCYLEGKTQVEAAAVLGVCKATVKNRLERGRALLRARLERRGLGPAAVLAAAAWPAAGSADVPAALVSSTIKAVGSSAAGQAAAGAVSAKVAALAEGVLKPVLSAKLRLVFAAWFAASGLGLLALQGQVADEKGAQAAQPPKPAARADEGAKERTAAAGRKPLELALEAAGDVKDAERKIRLLILVAQAQAKAGERAAALQTLHQSFMLADALPNEDNHDFYVRLNVLGPIAGAEAQAGDVDAARKAVEAMRMPKVEGVCVVDPEFLENNRATARVEIAIAQARAGKPQEASETLGQLDEKRREGFGAPAWAEIAAAHARAGDWKRADETVKAIENAVYRVRGRLAIANLQAKAGKSDAARASIAEALRAIPPETPGDTPGQTNRAGGLQLIALAQAELGDGATALLTAESIPDLPPVGDAKILQFPYKAMTIAMLRAQAGDYRAAKKAADAITGDFQDGSTRAHAFRLIARAQAEGKDVNGAMETAATIEHGFEKAAAHIEVAQAQARAGDHDGAARTFEKALGFAEAVPEAPGKSDLHRAYFRFSLLRALAAAQAEAGQEKAAGVWIATQSFPYHKACALVGLAEGIAAGRGCGQAAGYHLRKETDN